MITPATDSSFSQNTRQASDSLAQSSNKAFDAARDYSSELADSAEKNLNNLQRKVEPALDKFATRAQELAQRGMDMAAHTKDQAKEQLANYSAVTTRYVADKPMQSILIAAAVGAGLALLLSASNRRHYR